MKLLFWCDPFWPAVGGIPVIAARLAASLAERGYELHVVADEAPADTPAPPALDVAIHRYPFLRVLRSRNPAHSVALIRTIADLKRAVRPDCILLYAVSPGVFFHLGTRAAWQVPSIVTLHSSVARYAARAEGLVGQSLADAAWVMACCENARQDARDRYPVIDGKTSVVPNAVVPSAEAPPPVRMTPLRLLHIGRLVPEKGVDLAIAALPAILNRAPDAQLRIAGDGPLHETLAHQAAELGVADRVEILGFVAQPVLSRLLGDASIVVQPSRNEGISLAALEAAHAGRPVVAARVGGFPELIVDGETGLLVPPESVRALSDAIVRLVDDPAEARRMGINARRRAQESFRWSDYVDAYDERLRAVGGTR